jgi:endonuclease/exonuclease/phosphatase family metal-dependent hydrolase
MGGYLLHFPPMTVRILTLNIWNRGGPWEERLATIRAGVAEWEPDIIALQEVLRPMEGEGFDQAALIGEGFGYHVAYGAAFEAGGIGFGNAVLSRWPILRHQTFALPQLEAPEARCLLFAEVDAPFGALPFFVTHLSWRMEEGDVREAQVKAIATHVRELCPAPAFPPVVTGDFNASPDADEIRYMRGLCSLGGKRVYFADAFGLVGRGDGTTFSRRNPFAADLPEPDRRIDYIFVGGDDRGRGEPIEAHVCFDRSYRGVHASDHYGVIATLRTEV